MLLPKFICFSTVWRDPFTSQTHPALDTAICRAYLLFFVGFSSLQSLYCNIVPFSCSRVYHLDLDDIIPPKSSIQLQYYVHCRQHSMLI